MTRDSSHDDGEDDYDIIAVITLKQKNIIDCNSVVSAVSAIPTKLESTRYL